MVDRHCRGRLDLFPSTKVKNRLKKYPINNNQIMIMYHFCMFLTGSQININKTHNIGIQIKQKELTKTFMMISSEKNLLYIGLHIKIFQRC